MDGQAPSPAGCADAASPRSSICGGNGGADWHETERAASDRLGIWHIDFRLSARRQPTPEEAQRPLAVMRDAPKPLLIPCLGGADRAGRRPLIAGVEGGGEIAAERQLSLSCGRFGVPWLSWPWPMNRTWKAVEPLLGYRDS